MLSKGDQSSISIESNDNLSCSSPPVHDPDQLLNEDFGSIIPFNQSSKGNQKIPVGVSLSHPSISVTVAEFDNADDVSFKGGSSCLSGRQHKLLCVNPKSRINASSTEVIRIDYNIPDTIIIKPPSSGERVDMNLGEWCPMYVFPFVEGFRFPFPPLVSSVLNHFEVAPCQLMPNAWRVLLSLCRFSEVFGKGIDLEDFMTCYTLQEHDTDRGRIKTVVRSGEKRLVLGMLDNYRGWKDKYLFFKGNDMFEPNSPSFPLAWKPFNKDYNHLPRLTPARKEKLDFLLARPAEERNHTRLLRRSDLLSSYLWAQVRLHSTVANGTRPLSVSELIRLRCLERIGFSLDPLWSLSDVNRIRADSLVDKMSFKIPATKDAMERAGAKRKSQSASVSIKSTNMALDVPVTKITEASQAKKQRANVEDEVKSVLISESTNVFLDPSTIEGHVKELATEDELRHTKEMGPIRVADDIVATSYRALIGAMSLRNETKVHVDRIKQQKKTISDLTKDKETLTEEIKQLQIKAARVDELENDFNKEKARADGLIQEMESLATDCLVQARGEMMLDYSRGLADKWDVTSELDVFQSYLPERYADAVAKLDKMEVPERAINRALEAVDQQVNESDENMLP